MQTLHRHRVLAAALLGAALLYTSQMRLGLGVLAWVAPVPWLFALRHAGSNRARALVLGAMPLVWVAITDKIVTAPMPHAAALAFGIPIGGVLALPYAAFAWLRPRLAPAALVAAFASAAVLAEWALSNVLPYGTWGAAVNTQLDQLALLQLASVTGAQGIALLVAGVAASLESWLAHRDAPSRRTLGLALAAVALVVLLGQARLALDGDTGREVVRVATVDSPATSAGAPLPSPAEVAATNATLAERTRAAAAAGARLVVWTEASTVLRAEADEPAFLSWASDVARDAHVRLVLGYVVPVTLEPLSYRNTLVMIASDGTRAPLYLKHHPVPGEPAVPGTGPMPLALDPELGRVSAALCYDYDFPRLGLAQAALGADVVALPSSDWRGIDPIHAQMAVPRAIEDGVSVVRATRFGSSTVIDPHGRVRAMHSAFDTGARTTLADIPTHGVRTIYGTVGDVLPAGLALGWTALGLRGVIARLRRRAATPRATSPSIA